MKKAYDYLIIGGGIVGMTIARTLKLRQANSMVAILEKENIMGSHASGRSGGVLQAGFYHSPDLSINKLIKEGNQLMTQYCIENKLPIRRKGQLIVAKTEEEVKGLQILKQRAELNGVHIKTLNEGEAAEIEPSIKTVRQALYCPSVSSVNSQLVCNKMAEELINLRVDLHCNTKFLGQSKEGVYTNKGEFKAGKIITAGGVYADKIAKKFGIAKDYTILPFYVGLLKSKENTTKLHTNIYSVPNFNFPYVGVYLSIATEGGLKIGPCVTPALWREAYSGLSNYSLKENIESVIGMLKLGLLYNTKDVNFIKIETMELLKRNKIFFKSEILKLVKDVDLKTCDWDTKNGILPNLFDVKKRKFLDGLVVFADSKYCHILNPQFPGFTSSLAQAKYIVENYLQ